MTGTGNMRVTCNKKNKQYNGLYLQIFFINSNVLLYFSSESNDINWPPVISQSTFAFPHVFLEKLGLTQIPL